MKIETKKIYSPYQIRSHDLWSSVPEAQVQHLRGRMSFWSKVHRAFLINSNLHTFLISLAISTIFILAICICRLIFIPAASRQYMPSEHDHVEDIELYTIGGLHPVHLGDIYDNRYKILHKLGSGGFSTVWLVRDTVLSSYVALKIILAEESQDSSELEVLNLLGTRTDEKSSGKEGRKYMGTLLDYCTIYGPNGHHLCLVSDLMGPSISALSDSPGKIGDGRRLQAGFTQRIARQVVQALRFMHLRNLCHGGVLKYLSQRGDCAKIARSYFFKYTIQNCIYRSPVGRRVISTSWQAEN